MNRKFDPNKLALLNNPKRLNDIPPGYIFKRLDCGEIEVIIEIGAGTGFFSKIFFENLRPKKLLACDISYNMLKWLKENISSKYPQIIPIKNQERTLPLKDKIGDMVFMINLHHELKDPISILKEAIRILKQNGKILIIDWKKKLMKEGPPLHIRCIPENIKEQMQQVGFKKIEIYRELSKHFVIIGKKYQDIF